MHVITARNVCQAYAKGLNFFHSAIQEGLRPIPCRSNKAGSATYEADGPVTTVFEYPWERVLFDEHRDANPFFHLFEALWMLAGRNDVKFLSKFSSTISDIVSDDGVTQNGAYGYRWRNHFLYDQILEVVEQLRFDPMSRRAVIAIWDGEMDQRSGSKDIPCNLSIKFCLRTGKLNMQVFNRSNDMIWGAYGANAVHFSMLQEVIAVILQVPVGRYWQVSGNFHVYEPAWEKYGRQPGGFAPISFNNRYPYVESVSLYTRNGSNRYILGDIEAFCQGVDSDAVVIPQRAGRDVPPNPFFIRAAAPMLEAWLRYKQDDLDGAINALRSSGSVVDWVVAGAEWLERRKASRLKKAQA